MTAHPAVRSNSLKLHILSDLHFEYDADFKVPKTDADVLILAGDIMPGLQGMARFTRSGKPVLYVPGNHEYYGETIDGMGAALKLFGKPFGIQLLDCDEIVVGGVRFLGATLWTSFELFGAERCGEATAHADHHLNDYICIHGQHGQPLTPGQTVSLHLRAVDWLERKLAEPFDGTTVVITHHAPHPDSLDPQHSDKLIAAAYASDLTHLMGKAQLWIHGHTHLSRDYTIEGTRIVANPKGYCNENADFNPAFVVTI